MSVLDEARSLARRHALAHQDERNPYPTLCREWWAYSSEYSRVIHMAPSARRRMAFVELAPEQFDRATLQAIADGGIMDGNALYLPAGKLSMADTRAREARILAGGAR